MKNAMTIFMLLIGMLSLQAQVEKQTTENANFQADMIHVLDHLDLSEVTSDFFYDKAFPFFPIQQFDGTPTSPSININQYGKILATLYGAAMDSTVALPNPTTYMEAVKSSANSNTILLTLIMYDYHRFKEDAITNNLIDSINGQLFDVPNRPESPYELKTVFAGATLNSNPNDLSLSFRMPDSLLFFNQIGTIQSLAIDLDDGTGFQNFGWNQTIYTNYSVDGLKELSIKCTLTDGTILYCNTGITIEASSQTEDYSNLPDLDIIVPATSEHAGGMLNVFLNCPSDGLVKPFVIIDGFDPPQNNNRSYENMIDRLKTQAFPSSNPIELIDYLEAEGYDLIFMDHNYGSDYLQRNAEFVEDAIDAINAQKTTNGSNEPNIIAGASMGAVIGKYALLEMEQDGEIHDTEIFLSLDGPMRGVNIPLGIQEALIHVANTEVTSININLGIKEYNFLGKTLKEYVPELANAVAVLDEPAVKQFLYYQAKSPLINAEHTAFFSELAQLGEPTNFEYIAISSGSVTSSPQQLFDAGEKLIEINFDWGDISDILNYHAGFSSFWADFTHIWTAIINTASLGILNTTVKADFDIWGLPDNPTNYEKIYHGKLKVKVLGIKLIKTDRDIEVKETHPYDSAPGGLVGFDPSGIPSVWSNEVNIHYNAYCFVPTVSSLDIDLADINNNLFADLTDPQNVTTNLSALVRFDASTDASVESYGNFQENQFHAKINTTNAPYLLYEIGGINDLIGINVIGNRTYNYGESNVPFDSSNPEAIGATSSRIDNNLTIENQGKLWINKNALIAFTDEVNPSNTTDSEFEVHIRKKCTANTTVNVRNGGELKIGEWDNNIKNTGTLSIEKGGTLLIENNGHVELDQLSKIIVVDGGKLEVAGGGTLRLTKGAKVLVEEGGQLIIHAGANIDLRYNDFWDGTQTIEGSSIKIKDGGELVINGTFNFSGSGFFEFDQNNITTFNAPFELTGNGKTDRFIRLNNKATLDVGISEKIILKHGLVEYDTGSKIQIGISGEIEAEHVTFDAYDIDNDNKGIYADNAAKVNLLDADFNNFWTGIEAYNMNLSTDVFKLSLVYFNDCEIGIYADLCKFLDLDGAYFTPYDDVSTAMELTNVEQIDFVGEANGFDNPLGAIQISNNLTSNVHALTEFTNFKVDGADIKDNEVGIYVKDDSRVDILVTNGALIDNNTYGIKADGSSSPQTIFANVTVNRGSQISNNDKGIYIQKGMNYNQPNSNLKKGYGTIEMTCAKLLDNLSGVEGEDL